MARALGFMLKHSLRSYVLLFIEVRRVEVALDNAYALVVF